MSPDPSTFALSRRRVLSSVAAAGALSAAGCTTTLPPLGQRVRFGRIDFPQSDPPVYRKWIPARSALPEGHGKTTHAARPRTLPPGTLGRGLFVGPSDYLGTDFDAYERAVDAGGAYVFEGPTDPAVVADALDGTGYEPAGSYEAYALYDRDDAPRAVAVTDGTVLWAQGENRRHSIEVAADVGAGRIERRHETDDDFAAMTNAMGANEFDIIDGLDLGLESTADALLTGTSHAYRENAAYFRTQHLFESAESVPEASIKRELRASETAVRAAAVDVRTEGRRVIIETRTDGSDVGVDWRTPQITWGADHDPDAGTVTLRHEAGHSVDAEALVVSTRDSGASDSGFPEADGRQFAEVYDTVRPGDTLEVTVGESTVSVSVSFRPSEHRSSRLFTYDLS